MSGGEPTIPHSIADWVQGYESDARLRGFRCPACGLVTATWGIACPRCGHRGFDEHPLSGRGKVVAYTILAVPGDEFLNEAPYAYVIVELDGGGRLTGWMPGVRTEADVRVGERVRFAPSYRPGVQFAKEAEGASQG